MVNKAQLSQIIRDKSKFSLGSILEKGFDLGFKSTGWMLLLFLMIAVFSFLVSFLPKYYLFGFEIVDVLQQIFVYSAIGAGLAIFYKNRAENEKYDFSDLFKGIVVNYPQIILLAIINFAISLLLNNGLGWLIGSQITSIGTKISSIIDISKLILNDFSSFMGLAAIGLLLQLVTYIMLFFSTYLVVIRKLKAVDALALSLKLGAKFFFQLLGLLVLVVIINLIGAVILGLGLIFTIPMSLAIFYFSYHTLVEVHVNEEERFVFDEDILDA